MGKETKFTEPGLVYLCLIQYLPYALGTPINVSLVPTYYRKQEVLKGQIASPGPVTVAAQDWVSLLPHSAQEAPRPPHAVFRLWIARGSHHQGDA